LERRWCKMMSSECSCYCGKLFWVLNGNTLNLKQTLDYTYSCIFTGLIQREDLVSQTIAVHHPEYGISVQGEYQGRVSFKNYSLTDATIILKNVSFSDAGEYICKAVTFPLGNTQSSTTVTVLGKSTSL
uniref:Ig-like domain-containing protein n=1 Tax=Accipiter nisus TaxID=211598 RepID=A0A8B9NPM3_9AVES